jgi:hypothetical protein
MEHSHRSLSNLQVKSCTKVVQTLEKKMTTRTAGTITSRSTSTTGGDWLRIGLVIVATIGTLIVNFLANYLPLNNQGTGEISDRFDVYFVPAGYVFSIWGLIYLGIIGYSVYQALPAQHSNSLLRRTGWLYVLTGLFNSTWIFLWHYNLFGLSVVVMLALLVTLITLYLRVAEQRTRLSRGATWLVHIVFSVYLGWISVATIANITSYLDFINWNGFGIGDMTWAIIMLLVATVVGLFFAIRLFDAAYVAVLVWAFAGIAVKHSDTQPILFTAGATAVLLALAMLWALPKWRSQVL